MAVRAVEEAGQVALGAGPWEAVASAELEWVLGRIKIIAYSKYFSEKMPRRLGKNC